MIYEMRVYTSMPGRREAVLSRFREHTMRIFPRHGIEVVGFWTPEIGSGTQCELVYLCVYDDIAARQRAWESFRRDPEWIAVRQETEKEGQIVAEVDVKILKPTDFSPIK
ncbi:MAG: NIPSNAP family protein [Candidatus Poribacteria bacterium]|nr:NIPSNAP family protein [Candidatus Poribacteria bacterium]